MARPLFLGKVDRPKREGGKPSRFHGGIFLEMALVCILETFIYSD